MSTNRKRKPSSGGWQNPAPGMRFIVSAKRDASGNVMRQERDNRFAKLRKLTDDIRLDRQIRDDLREVWN